jgi:non-ribosomal peptide synthetase component E (peptide arylation enzyme)
MRWNISHDDSVFITSFLWTGPSMAGIYAAPQVGGKCYLMERFDPEEAMQIIERERPTYFTGFPVHLIQMARHPGLTKYKVDSFRFLSHGGAPFPQGICEEVEQKFNANLISYYGSLDSLLSMGVDMDAPKEVRYTSVGKIHPWGEVKLLDDNGIEVLQGEVGVVYCRGPFGSGGYFKDLEMTLKSWGELGINGWFNMEDLGRMDTEGNLMLVGRKKDMILRGGQNVYPAEIEGYLNAYHKILNVCVVPMPDPTLGEKMCAYIIPRQSEVITLEEVVDYLLGMKMAKYKLPERIELVPEFPMLGDKVNKRALIEDITAKLETALHSKSV